MSSILRYPKSLTVTAFLLSTPQTGVDSILVTHAMLGPLFAIYRPVVALLTGIAGGSLVGLLEERPPRPKAGQTAPETETGATCTEDCCSASPHLSGWQRALRYGLVTLPRDIGTPLLVGVLIAGALSALVPPGSLTAYLGGGLLSILLLMAAGIPLYVCATASVPIAAGFIHMGASPGAALAFLIAGPATNAATITTVLRVMGRRTAAVYLTTVGLSAVVFGVLLNWMAPKAAAAIPQLAIHVHGPTETSWLFHLVAVALVVVLVHAYLGGKMGRHRRDETTIVPATQEEEKAAQQVELAITGMNCSHCSETVQRAITECSGVQAVEVDLGRGRARIRGTGLDPVAMVQVVTSLGYRASLVESTGSGS